MKKTLKLFTIGYTDAEGKTTYTDVFAYDIKKAIDWAEKKGIDVNAVTYVSSKVAEVAE